MEQIARTTRQLGAAIRRQRKSVGLSQLQLGEKIRYRQATISNLEAGAGAARIQTLLDALAALDLEMVIRPRSKGSARAFEDIF